MLAGALKHGDVWEARGMHLKRWNSTQHGRRQGKQVLIKDLAGSHYVEHGGKNLSVTLFFNFVPDQRIRRCDGLFPM